MLYAQSPVDGAFPGGAVTKNPPAIDGDAEELGRLQTMGWQRAGHDWMTNTRTHLLPDTSD